MKKIQESEVNVKKHKMGCCKVKGLLLVVLREKQSGTIQHNRARGAGSPFSLGLNDFYNHPKIRLNSNFSLI